METLNVVLPIVLYLLTCVLIIMLIVLALKLMRTVDKYNELADNLSRKINTLNNFFHIIDIVTDKVSFLSDRLVDGIASLIAKVFAKKKRKDEEDE